MYYFELFELPLSLQIDEKKIIEKYYILSKKYHPDRYVLATEAEKEMALKMTAEIHQAKDTLLNLQNRLQYILKEKKIIVDDEKYILPNDFLMDMMELNEELMDAKNDEILKVKIVEHIQEIEETLYAAVSKYFEIEDMEVNKPDYENLKAYYYKKKYLERIKAQLERN